MSAEADFSRMATRRHEGRPGHLRPSDGDETGDKPTKRQQHKKRFIIATVVVVLVVCAIIAIVVAVIIARDKSEKEDKPIPRTNRTLLPDKITGSGEYDVVVNSGDFTHFEMDLEEPSDVSIDLEKPEDNDVTLAVYARHGQPPNNVLYDDIQKVIESPDKRRKRALTGKLVSVKFRGLRTGAWFFAFFNAGDELVSMPGAIDLKKATSCPNECSGHGTCRAGQCQCDDGWGGEDCSKSESGVTEEPVTCPPPRCSSHGQLQPNNTCKCDQGWSGFYCEEVTQGVSDTTAPSTCPTCPSAPSTCPTCPSAPSTCPTCPSAPSTCPTCPAPSCSSHGQLNPETNVCDCEDGWSGAHCEEAESGGPVTCPPPQCSSHGQIQPDNICKCDEGWSGIYCEEAEDKECPTMKCSSHGRLEGDACNCDVGWTGEFCENVIEGAVSTTTTSPSVSTTSSGGSCPTPSTPTEPPTLPVGSGALLQMDIPGLGVNYVSITLTQTSDALLEIAPSSQSTQLAIYARRGGEKPNFSVYDMVQKVSIVSGTSPSTTTLKYLDIGSWILALYNGRAESVQLLVTFTFPVSPARCPENCSGRGTCNNGVCECNLGWGGMACAEAAAAPCIPNNCTVNGQFVDGNCNCYAGWKGEFCDEVDCVPSDCNGKGQCVAGQCQCQEGWKGDTCNEADCVPSDCNNNGRCENAICVCGTGWQGSTCTIPQLACPNDCSGHGTCEDTTGSCTCEPTWTGSACDTKLCADCSEFGQCVNGTCVCQQGWTEDSCRQRTCPDPCDVHGTCNNGTCECDKGWAGQLCSSVGCPGDCSGNGECVQYGTEWDCQCESNFKGEDCSYGTESSCDDGLDNDKDGLTDCDDADCCSQEECVNTEQCGADVADPQDLVQTNSSTTQSFVDQVRFLYESGAVQQGLNESALDNQRLCVLRGKVVTQQKVPLPSVNVSVASKPTFGYSVTRKDGRYDIVLNCGGRVSLQFNRQQFVGAQRRVDTVVWQYIDVSETALVPLNTKVAEVDLTKNKTQVAEGGKTVDEDGSRNPSLVFEPGTKVVVRDMENGTEYEVAVPHIRMTEFTVGSSGREAMPAELPPLVGYTYCTEISIDEATVDGTTEVHFNQPVAFYVENYLGFPVGTAVPVGYYNRTLGEWVSAENGRVVQILDGFEFDVEGMGEPATEEARKQLGISEDELLSLRDKYQVGDTLWRATITHLTPYDCNFPYGPPEGGCSPSECDDIPDPDPDPCSQPGSGTGSGSGRSRKTRSLAHNPNPVPNSPSKASMRKLMVESPGDDPREQTGRPAEEDEEGVVYMGHDLKPKFKYQSWEGIYDEEDDGTETCAVTGETCGEIYPFQNQLQSPSQMRLGIAGTQFQLHYNFYRQEGYKSVLSIPLSGPNLPDSVKNIFVEIQVAGVTHSAKLPPQKDSTYTFVWDRLDAYGRRVNGYAPATIRIGYEYELVYYAVPRDFSASFNRFSSVSSTRVSRASQTAVFYVEKEAALSGNELPDVGMGGWTLDVHHSYDAVTGTVYKGSGDKYQSRNENVVRTLVGTGTTAMNCQACGEGVGTEARLTSPVALARGVNGDLYIVDHKFIRRYDSKGIVSTIVVLPWNPRYRNYMAVNPRDGAILLSDPNNFKIHRIDPETGDMEVFAGTGSKCLAWDDQCGDSGLAIEATFSNPKGIAVGKDGNVFVVDGRRIRTIGSDGIITRYLGSNRRTGQNIQKPSDRYNLNIGEAFLTEPTAITVDKTDESLYIVDGKLLLKLTREGKLKITAGIPPEKTNGAYREPEQVTKAKQHQFDAPLSSVALGPNGKLYLAETDYNYVNRIHQLDTGANTISQISGTETQCPCANRACSCFDGEGQIPINARYWAPVALTVSPNGQIVIADLGNRRVRATKIRAENTIVDANEYVVPDTSETRVHIFNSKGLHLRTVDLVTQTTEYEFMYNEDEKLKAVVDKYNRTMSVERRSDGKLHAFVAPRGQRSLVTLDGNGMLRSLAAESGIPAKFSYDDEGLMIEHDPPAGCLQQYEYNEYGRLLKISRGQGITQHFTEANTGSGTTRTATSLTGRRQIQRHTFKGSEQMTSHKIGVVQGVTIFDDTEDELVKQQPNGMQLRYGYKPSAIWTSSLLVPAYFHLTTPKKKRKMRVEFEQSATFSDLNDPFSVSGIKKEVRKNGVLTSTREEDFVSRRADLYHYAGGSKYLAARERYDVDRRVIYDVSPERPLAERFTVYDDQQKLVTQTRDGISAWYKYVSFEYRGVNVLNNAGKRTEDKGYDGLRIRYTYNSDNQMTSMVYPSGREYKFQYNSCGNLVAIEMPSGAVHKLRTGLSKRRRHEIYQSAGDTPYSVATLFDLDGQLRQQLYASDRNTNYTYDEAYRPTSVQYDDTLIIYRYISGTTDPDFIYRYENQQLDSVIAIGRDGMLVDSVGLRLFPDSRDNDAQFKYGHDENFFVDSIKAAVLDETFSTNLGSDVYGKPTHHGTFQFQFPDSQKTQIGDGTFSCTYTVDTHGVLTSHTCSINNVAVFDQTLQRQNNDTSIVSKTVKIGQEDSVTNNYSYDIDGQLTSVKEDGTVSESYAFDTDGNRISWTDAGQSHTAKYDEDDRISEVDGDAYYHSPDGFLSKTPRGDLVYNIHGELTEFATIDFTAITYRYDGLHRLIERKSGENKVQFIYGDHRDPIKMSHYVVNGKVHAVYYDLRGFAMAIQTNDAWYYIVCDHVGTPLAIFDADGTVVKRMKYTSFGRLVSDSDPSFYFPIGFAGGIYDRETGLVHFFFRDYDPVIGQWTARDPSLFSSYQPNLYQYIFNDPINLRDPLGLWCFSVSITVFWSGGGKICHSDGQTTVCVEAGVGTPGGSVGYDPLGEAEKRNGYSGSVYGEVSADIDGLIDVSMGVEVGVYDSNTGLFDPCKSKLESKIGTSHRNTLTGSINAAGQVDVKLGIDSSVSGSIDVGTKNLSPLSAKAGVRGCYTGGG